MITSLLPHVFRRIPPEALAGLESGTLKLFGSVIRRSDTGAIAYHLQEAAPLAGKLGTVAMNPPLGVAKIVADGLQNEVNRRAITNVGAKVANVTQIASLNLALTGAGIGVTAVCFALVAKRLDRIEDGLASLEEKLDEVIAKIDEATHRETQDLFSHIRGLAEQYENSWELADKGRAEKVVEKVWHEGATLQDMSERRADHAMRTPALGYHASKPFLDAFAIISGLRIAALLAVDEIDVARRIERDSTEKLMHITGSIGLTDLLASTPNPEAPGSLEWQLEMARSSEELWPTVAEIRVREQCLATRTTVLPMLDETGVRPREWLEQARNEVEADILCLQTISERAIE